jgi:hypothetical protein
MGVVAGTLVVLALVLGCVVFFVLALIKAISTRRTSWIIAAAISTVPVLCAIVFLVAAFVTGFKKGFRQAREIAAAKQGQPSDLLSADMSAIHGTAIPYAISFPWLSAWHDDTEQAHFDHFMFYHDSYVGIIAEGIGLGTPQAVCDLAQMNLAARAAQHSFTKAVPVTIDARPWLTYDADANVKGIPIKYRFYVYADTNYTFQIITWTGPVMFDRTAPVFDRIAKSFKLPK